MFILLKIVIIIFLLFDFLSRSSTTTPMSKDFSIIKNVVISILTTCYPNQTVVVLCDTPDSNLIQSLWSSSLSLIPVIIHNTSNIFDESIEQLNKVNFFIISFESIDKFDETIISLQNTPWWNIMATFLILDRSNGACENAKNILQTSWQFNILISIFLCHDSNQLMVYTFNPFTKRAPEPWKHVKISNPPNDRWNIFSRQYHDDDICINLDFDRTEHLDGYLVNATSVIFYGNSALLKPHFDVSNLSISDMVTYDITTAFQKSLNINLQVDFLEYNFQDPLSIYYGLGNQYDLTLGVLPMHAIENFTILYPTTAFYTAMVMQKRGFYTPLEKIKNYYGIITAISLIVVLVIVGFIVIKSQKNRGFAFALFEILRLLTNASLYSKMKTQSLRIFFFVIFFYFLIMHATFSGRLSSFLTSHELRKTPEFSIDLKDDYIRRIYVPRDISFDYSHPIIQSKIILMDNFDCGSVILNDSTAVCLNDRLDLIFLASENDNLHVSKEPLASDYFSFIARNNWPLRDRADTVMIWFSDFGYSSDFWVTKFTEKEEEHIKRVEARSEIKYRAVSYLDFSFAFILLSFGNILAIICFFVELLTFKVCKKVD